jgi:fibronectin-binding autotransporter adhesin
MKTKRSRRTGITARVHQFIIILVTLLFVMAATGPVRAAPVNWTDTTGLWNVAANWSSNPLLPSGADNVTISVAGVQTITHGTGTDTINMLTIGTSTNTLLVNSGSTLAISSGGTNIGTIRADGLGSALGLNGGTFTNTGGTLDAINNAVVGLNGVNMVGGILSSSGGGTFIANSGANILNGVTLNGTMDMTTVANSRERIGNGMTLNGAVNIANGGIVSLDSTLGAVNSVGGTGTFNLNDAGARLALEGTGTTTLGANIVVRGQGNIGTPLLAGGTNALINNGRISADVVVGTLNITPGAGSGSFTNNNLLDARGGGQLLLSTSINNAAGQVAAAALARSRPSPAATTSSTASTSAARST